MTDETVITPETLTDEVVDKFFENEGKFDEPVPEVTKEEPKEESVAEEPKEEKKVNLGALHEERAKRKAEKERADRLERELNELRAAQKQQEPTYEEDPLETLRREHEQVKQVLIAQANQTVAQRKEQEYWAQIAEKEAEFKADKPDFDDAVKFLAESRLSELADLGFTEKEANKVLQDEIKWISDKAMADEVNPAERFWNLANRRGFKAKTAEQPKSDTKLDNIKKGLATNKSLPPASKSANQDLTAEALADMKVDVLTSLRGQTEFDKAWAKLFG